MNNANKQMKGALLAFVVLQMIYLFFFFINFPDSFRDVLAVHADVPDAISGWLSTLTMLGYCVTCLGAVAQLVLRKPAFLLWFQISGAVALGGNFIVYLLRQVSEGWYYSYETDYYWGLFIAALFWTVIWCMYFARSSRVYSYMGEDPTYLRMAVFTKSMKTPDPWVERLPYPFYPPQQANFSNGPQPQQPMSPMGPPPVPPYSSPYSVVNQAYPPQQPGMANGYPVPPPPSVPPQNYPVQNQQPGYSQSPPYPPPQSYQQGAGGQPGFHYPNNQ